MYTESAAYGFGIVRYPLRNCMATMNLFSQNLGSVSTYDELTRLQGQHSDLDPEFVTLSAHEQLHPLRGLIESWWQQFELYADPNFPTEFKTHLAQRFWELYLGITLLSRGFGLGCNGRGQPDFDVRDRETGKRVAWIEAISVGRGTGNDRVPDTEISKAGQAKVFDSPIDRILLRLANGIDVKHQRYLRYVNDGIVKASEPFIIASNRSQTEVIPLDHPMPLILKVIFGIGNLALDIGPTKGNRPEPFWEGRPFIAKQNESPVSILFFRDAAYEGISAVINCVDSICSSPYRPEALGENLCIVHNPLAKNPLNKGCFPFGAEYRVEGEYLKKVRSASHYDVMVPPGTF
jgi:hypothetical protein